LNKSDILAFINSNRSCYLATVEGNKPHVRAMGIHQADEDGIIIQSCVLKDVHKQICDNQNVELCFLKEGVQIRVSGTVEFVDDTKFRDEVIAKRPRLNEIIEKHGNEVITLYRLRHGLATVWTHETDLDPKIYIEL